MNHTSAVATPVSTPLVDANVRTVALLAGVALLSLLTYYFVGLDEGMTSVFGRSVALHELFHDGRHLLGFPCH